MDVLVEPVDGSELERLVTVLLNMTALVSRVIEASMAAGGDGPEIVDRVAAQLASSLAFVAEHHTDVELRGAVQILIEATLSTAEDLDVGDAFGP
jgi:hypothetical protein